MEQVEHTIGKRDAAFLPRSPSLSLYPGRNLVRWTARFQSLLAAEGWKWSTRSFFNGILITSS